MPSDIPLVRAWDFTQSIGVNTHINWKNSGSSYRDPAVTQRSLAYLGATHVRDGVPHDNWTLPEYVAIAQTGLKFVLITSGPTINLAYDLSQIRQLAAAVPGSVAAIEGLNEFNTNHYSFGGSHSYNNPAWAQVFGPALFNAVKADPVLSGIPIIASSMARSTALDLQQHGDVGAFVDRSNWHVYHGNGEQPLRNIASGIAQARRTAPGKPVVITEAGYSTVVEGTDWGSAGNLSTHAVLTVNTLLDAFRLGAKQTYLYELLDDVANPSSSDLEGNFGLFLADGTPKPAATAVHNLTTILADNGSNAPTFTPSPSQATINGLPATGASMLMQKSDGTSDLVIWNEPAIWNQATQSAITPPGTSITVDLGATYASVKVFNPLSGTAPIQTLTNSNRLELNLTSEPYIVEFSTAGAAAPAAVAAGQQATTTGADTLELRLAGDAWQGNPQFQVAIDGKALGEPQMVFASRARGEGQNFLFTGDFGPGARTLSITFLNDAYGGTAAMDRNLYVLGAKLDGVSYVADPITLHDNSAAARIEVFNN